MVASEHARRRSLAGQGAPVESESLLNSRIEVPLPVRARPRDDRKTVGVWSPFGQVYEAHGQVELSLGRKPQPPTVIPPPPPPTSGASKLRLKNTQPVVDKSSDDLHAVARQPKLPKASERGLGLGLGLAPQRFPALQPRYGTIPYSLSPGEEQTLSRWNMVLALTALTHRPHCALDPPTALCP